MNNQEALDFFKKMSETSSDPKSVKLANSSDFSQMDADFILNFVNNNSSILDLGSGTGLIINKIFDKVGTIDAVEPFKSFSKFIVKAPNVRIYNQTFENCNFVSKSYDCVTIFGTMHYFNEQEAINIYKKFIPLLKNGGFIIVKNQFGLNEDVTVEGYSEEQKTNYFAQYRYVDKEVDILKDAGCTKVKVVDIYPPECNRWDNTHFYALVGEKNNN